MDLFQAFISMDFESLPKISDVFQQEELLKNNLGPKGYLLDHYTSMFFHLLSQIDIIGLQEEVFEAMADIMNSISDREIETLSRFQEKQTRKLLFLLSNADRFLNQALHTFLEKISLEFGSSVDIVDLRQTEETLSDLLGVEQMEHFREMLLKCFLPCPLCSFFLIGLSVEFARRFITRDLETDLELFRFFLHPFLNEKNG